MNKSSHAQINNKSLAVELYRCYGDSADWKNYKGDKMPDYGDLPENIKKHWEEVAKYVNEIVEQHHLVP